MFPKIFETNARRRKKEESSLHLKQTSISQRALHTNVHITAGTSHKRPYHSGHFTQTSISQRALHTNVHITVGTSHKRPYHSGHFTQTLTNTNTPAHTHACSSALMQMLHKPNTHILQMHINAHATAPQQSHTCSPTHANAHQHMHTCQTINTHAEAHQLT